MKLTKLTFAGQIDANRRPYFTFSLRFLSIFFIAICVRPVALHAEWKDEIGFTALKHRIGSDVPTGGTIRVAQVEMSPDVTGAYLPDLADAQLIGKNIQGLSGRSGISDHATTVGKYYFGLSSSVVPGVRLIDSYEANNWSAAGMLNFNSDSPPRPETRQVQNHSWIGSFASEELDVDALRRVDLLVQRDGVLIVAGVRNGAGTQLPRLLSSAYNILAVGLTNAQCSPGPTRIDNTGRSKPDLVAPLTATSWATPVVASSGSLLLEIIDQQKYLRSLTARQKRLAKPLLVKALLMGGATKTEWEDWHRGFASPCTDGSVPLDHRYGAGELNIDNSYRILASGEHEPSVTRDVPTTGWDYAGIDAHRSHRYYFEVPPSHSARSASILLTWNRKINIRPGTPLQMESSLADINLALHRADGFKPITKIDASVSRIDNVEHIYQRDLPSGQYMLEVYSDRAWEYCLTWDVEIAEIPNLPPRQLAVDPQITPAEPTEDLASAAPSDDESSNTALMSINP